MGFLDFYYKVEDKYYDLIDKIDTKIPIKKLTDKIDKVMPSMVFFLVLFLLIIFLVLFFLLYSPKTDVSFTFQNNGIQLIDNFNFSVLVDGKLYEGYAEEGFGIIKLPKSKTITISEIDLEDYTTEKDIYDFSKSLTINLVNKTILMPVTVYMQNIDGSNLSKNFDLLINCDKTNFSKNLIVTNSVANLEVPSNCGNIIFTPSLEGYKLTSGQICENLACSLEFSPITYNLKGNISNGALKVIVVNELGVSISNVKIKVYDSKDLRSEIDITNTNNLGISNISDLPIGSYTVYAIKDNASSYVNIEILENELTEIKIQLSQPTKGYVNVNFSSSYNLSGDLSLKNSSGLVIYKGTVNNNKIDLPVYDYGIYYLDFNPNNEDLAPISNYQLDIKSTSTNFTILVKKMSEYSRAKVNVKVLDEDLYPVEDVKVFLIDDLTQFDLISYDIDNTDEDGATSFIVPEGVYKLRLYNGFSETFSQSFIISQTNAGEIPEIDLNITMSFGYSLINLNIFDEDNDPLVGAKVSFYNKAGKNLGTKITNISGNVYSSFKSGHQIYYVVEDDDDDYYKYVSEARLLFTNENWEEDIKMKPLTNKDSSSVEFLGAFSKISSSSKESLTIGKEYYLGFDILINDIDDDFEFYLNLGDNELVDQEKFFIINSYTSAESDLLYEDLEEEILTTGEAKVAKSFFDVDDRGIYRVFYKIKVKDDSSVKLYDTLNFNWELFVDNISEYKESKSYAIGTNSVCDSDQFCGRYTLLDRTDDLYVETYEDKSYLLNSGHVYELNFDILNGINDSDGKIKNGYLQIYNALTEGESFAVVKENVSERSFLRISDLNIFGPNTEKENYKENYFGVILEKYLFDNFYSNKYISGKMVLTSIINEESYLNFLIVDDDKKIIVKGKPALSLLFNVNESKDMNVKLFPDRILAPEITQNVKVSVTSENNTLKDALVTFKIKKPTSKNYSVVKYCKDMPTDYLGVVNCELKAEDLVAGTYIQILVSKEGYNSYYNKKHDLEVSVKMFDFDPEILTVNLSYPSTKEGFDSLTLINNTASDIVYEYSDLVIDNYSYNNSGYLDISEMQNYIKNAYPNKIIKGRQLVYDGSTTLEGEARTELNNLFKASLNEVYAKDLTNKKNINGYLTLHFSTEGKSFTRIVPFEINLIVDGYPTNADNCLVIGFNSDNTNFVSDGSKAMSIPIIVYNTCGIESSNEIGNSFSPVNFNSAYATLKHNKGTLGLGNYSFVLNSVGNTELIYSVPKVFVNNWEGNTNNVYYGFIEFTPKGVYGNTNLSLSLLGAIKTSSGIKKVESNVLDFSVSVMDIKDCIKIKNKDGEEIDSLILEPVKGEIDSTNINPLYTDNQFEIQIENTCNMPLDITICRDNEGKVPEACGLYYDNLNSGSTNYKGYVGFTFEGVGENLYSKEILSLEGNKTIKINRPNVSGAYALELYGKTKDEDSYKRVKNILTNVQTSLPNNFMFSDNPFLNVNLENSKELNKRLQDTIIKGASIFDETNSNKDIYVSDVLRVYNMDVPGALSITNENTFANLLAESKKQDDKSGHGIKIGDGEELLFGNNVQDMTNAGVITSVVTGSTVAITALIVVLIMGLLEIPGLGWVAGAGLAVAAFFMAIGVISSIDDYQEAKYVIIKDKAIPLKLIDYNNSITLNEDDNYASLFVATGQNNYMYKIIKESVDASVGLKSEKWTESLNFEVSCDSDYEVDESAITYLKSTSPNPDDLLTFNDCGWVEQDNGKAYTISDDKKTVTFYPWCGGNAFSDPKLETYVIVGCKLKDKYWSRSLQNGVDSKYTKVGIFKNQFTGIDFTNCNTEWCYKIYDINVYGEFLGSLNNSIRVAFKNPNKENEITNYIGDSCTDIQGNVIGVTGEKAKPKVNYTWEFSDIDENFCSPILYNDNLDANQYCDSYQFLTSALKRLNLADKEISSLYDFQCVYLDSIYELKKDIKNENQNLKLELTFYDDTKTDLAIVITDTLHKNNLSNLYGKYLLYNDNEKLEIEQTVRDYNPITLNEITTYNTKNTILYNLGKKPEQSKVKPGNNILFSDNFTLIYQECTDSEKTNCSPINEYKFNVDINTFNWKGGCYYSQPSTRVLDNGKMILSNFYGDKSNDSEFEDKMFGIQNLLHYQAYLMQDGYTDDLIKDLLISDFANEIKTLIKNLDLETMVNENRFEIHNFDGSKVVSPGLYNVHILIDYNGLNTDLSKSKIEVVLEKISSPKVDSVFYYMPIDGTLGFTDKTRNGYGISLEGSSLKINSEQTGLDMINYNNITESTPVSNLVFNNNTSFSYLNIDKRGTVLELNRLDNTITDTIAILYLNSLKSKDYNVNIKNINQYQDTYFKYKISENGRNISVDKSILPWFVYNEDKAKLDLTKEPLSSNYPKVSEVDYLDNSAYIKYNANTINNNADYVIYTKIYYPQNNNYYIDIIKSLNLSNLKISQSVPKNYSVESLNSILEGIENKEFCISNNNLSTRVFVNENMSD